MNTGVELLIKRLKDCPEDFHYDPSTDRSSKWNSLLMEALRSDVITEEEKVALRAEVTEMGRARFTEKVMQALAGVDETSDEGKHYTSPYLKNIASGGQTQLSSTTQSPYSNIGGLTLVNDGNGKMVWANPAVSSVADAQAYQSEMMRQHLDEHRKQLKTVEVIRKKATQR